MERETDVQSQAALSWDEANRQAFQEMRGRRTDWHWWNARRRELAGYPKEAPRQRINRAVWVNALVRGKGMTWWRKRRREVLEGGRVLGVLEQDDED